MSRWPEKLSVLEFLIASLLQVALLKVMQGRAKGLVASSLAVLVTHYGRCALSRYESVGFRQALR
jgi:hypothetical protein